MQEFHRVDRATFREEIVPTRQPAVLRGLAADWPAVQAAKTGPEALAAYIKRFDDGRQVSAFLGQPAIGGKFWYREDMRGINFEQRMVPFAELFDAILSVADRPEPPAFYAGSIPILETVPGFAAENATDLPGPGAVARMWIGNRATVSTHFDESENIAVLVGGKRRFTLFPPEKVGNMYVGPFDFTFAGPPVSMVDHLNPDLARYPRFAEALPGAQVADLEPGDAIYIPYMWWHHVEARAPLNLLVNYWWDLTGKTYKGSPFKALMHAIMAIRDLPPTERAIWRDWFDNYVFGDGHAAVEHLPPHGRGALGEMTPEIARAIKSFVIDELKR